MLIRGDLVHCPELGQLDILHDHLLAVDPATGFITHLAPAVTPESQQLLAVPYPHATPTILPLGSFLLPIFCDLHLHAPQFLYQGTGLHLPLMQWLDEYAFKAEQRLDADPSLAELVYTRLAQRLAQNGTGAVLLFGTINEETNLILARAMHTAGLRAFVGKLSMDISTRPSYVEASASAALAAAHSFIENCRAIAGRAGPVQPVLTPRFVPTCSDALMIGLGELAAREGVRIQSHMSEAHDEVEWVRRERGVDDTTVFNRSSLLTSRTVQAHCTFLDPTELDVLARTGTAVAHCPLSNAYFSARPFRLREALRAGVRVGLGTDVAGGYSMDIMESMRMAVTVARMREGSRVIERDNVLGDVVDGETEKKAEGLAVDWKEALYLGTKGGAVALGLPKDSGTFAVGAPFDAQCIRLFEPISRRGIGQLDFFDIEGAASTGASRLTVEMVEKWWCLGNTENRSCVWVQGHQVYNT